MRLLVDAHIFDRNFQGVRTYIEGLYTHLIKHKDIDFYFAANKEEKLKETFGVAENIHYIHLPKGGRIKRLLLEYPRIIRQYKIDYAHFQYITPLIKTCKEIVTIHDLLFLDYPQYFPKLFTLKNKFLFRRSAKRADILLTVSDFSKKEIMNHFQISKELIYITYNSILPIPENIEEIDVKSKFNLKNYILTVGSKEPRKNHLSLIKAFVDLGLYEKEYKLVIVGGKGWENPSLCTYCEKLPDEKKKSIVFLKSSFEELVALYKGASLFVYPSYAEGFGIPPLEAVAYGCPLLCSNATAMKEFSLPEEISFNPHDIEELKKKMQIQLSHPTDIKNYRDAMLSKYNWSVIADNYYRIIRQLANL